MRSIPTLLSRTWPTPSPSERREPARCCCPACSTLLTSALVDRHVGQARQLRTVVNSKATAISFCKLCRYCACSCRYGATAVSCRMYEFVENLARGVPSDQISHECDWRCKYHRSCAHPSFRSVDLNLCDWTRHRR